MNVEMVIDGEDAVVAIPQQVVDAHGEGVTQFRNAVLANFPNWDSETREELDFQLFRLKHYA